MLEKYTELPSIDACHGSFNETNKDKNRFTTLRLLSRDQDRPVLKGFGPDANYVNAVYINSYSQRRAFVITQTPLKKTVSDFWSLVDDLKV